MNIATPARPRVLLADDHVHFLESVSRLLAADFDIVGTAANGRQALDLAKRLRPDVVVLDISMPDLNGFQTLAQLRREGLETRAVFLTMHEDDEFVAAAVKAGADAYVLKSHIHPDLITAIGHAHAGRLCVPSLTSLSAVAGSRHTVEFHADDSRYLDEVSKLVGTTLRSGEPVVFITSEANLIGVAERLDTPQMNVAMLKELGLYLPQNSARALSHVMRHGRPDKECLAEMVEDLNRLRLAAPNGPGRLTIVGDMSASLWLDGELDAALELERIWDELTRALPFFTVCCFPIDCFAEEDARDQLQNVCAEHSAVTSGH